jgi:hypothetical protein
MSNHLFQPATKQQARARVAFSGASGSGKTFWALTWASILAEGKPIAVIDTERGSASLYADQFTFDVLEMRPPYHPDRLVEALNSASAAGYGAIVVDSLTHFWSGQGGVLEIVDQASARFKGNSHAAWQVGTPIQQRMIDALLGFDGHLVATMRAKTEWVMEPDERGKVTPRKIGLAPQQRSDIEFEFTMMLEIEANTHRAHVAKSRFADFADKVFTTNDTAPSAEAFLEWLKSGRAMLSRNEGDSLKQRIANLEPFQRDYLKTRWVQEGLPKVELLGESERAVVEELIDEALLNVGATQDELEPEEAF